MRVVAFNCSPRKKGNTATMINVVLEELERRFGVSGIEEKAAREQSK